MIHVKDGSFSYSRRKKVFEGINFDLDRGEILCVMGANGTGKTTLIRCIAGVNELTSGAREIEDTDGRETRIGYVPQAKSLDLAYGVVDFVSFGRYNRRGFLQKPKADDYKAAEETLGTLGAEFLAERNIDQLSGGELQMCYVAKAICGEPDLLILDEPESNLDFYNQAQIINVVTDTARSRGTTIVMKTHFLNYADRTADKVLLMDKDSNQFGVASEILVPSRLERTFGVPICECQYEYKGNIEHSLHVR